jgi:AraC-like DNA-binding protein
MSEYCINLELKQYHNNTRKRNPYHEVESGEIAGLLTSIPFWFGQDNSGAIPLFADLLQELSHRYLGRYSAVQCLVNLLLVHTVRNFAGNTEKDYPLPQKMFDDRRRTIVDKYFNNKGNRSHSPKDLAQSIGVSVRQLNRIVLEYYSMTFKQKLTGYRIEQAKDLLTHTELPVKEISQRVGYISESYFCKVFKQIVRTTPSEYRVSGKGIN